MQYRKWGVAMEKNIIGDKIRLSRLTRKPILKHVDMIAKLDLLGLHFSETTLSKIESGDRHVKDYELVAIADVLEVNILWLLGREENPKMK